MKLTGVEVPVAELEKAEPSKVLVVIFDEHGTRKIYKVDRESIPTDESFLRVTAATANAEPSQGGCWVRISGNGMVWQNPCPY